MSDPVLTGLPPEFGDLRFELAVRNAVAASGRTVVALDDDPTGVQTVHNTPVLTRWSDSDLAQVLSERHPLVFILTNSRSLPEDEAVRLNREVVDNLLTAANQTDIRFVVASRGDSTLRGHVPAEPDAIAAKLGGVDGVLLVPAFFEGGRYTIGDTHWVREGETLVPAAETEFARDPSFGYTNSDLKRWIEEKSSGRVKASDVASLSIDDIRRGGPDRVTDRLRAMSDGRYVVVNAASYRDLEVVVMGLLQAEAEGKRFIYRTGAAFVRVRADIPARDLLTREELVGRSGAVPGLVVVGSHVRRSSEQLTQLLSTAAVSAIELDVQEILASPERRCAAIAAAQREISASLRREDIPVLYTSRSVVTVANADAQLAVSRSVSHALVEVVRGLDRAPGWVIAKGGITSSDIGTEALGVRRATVLGQIMPGIPVWRLGAETLWPGLPYVVFPGNVGGPTTLRDIVALLRGDS